MLYEAVTTVGAGYRALNAEIERMVAILQAECSSLAELEARGRREQAAIPLPMTLDAIEASGVRYPGVRFVQEHDLHGSRSYAVAKALEIARSQMG